MRKVIEVWIEGDVPRFLQNWQLPPGARVKKSSENLMRFFLHDEDTSEYERIKQVARQLGKAVELEGSFFVRDVTAQDCDAAEFLHLLHSSTPGIGFSSAYADREEMLAQSELPLHTRAAMQGWLISIGSGAYLFHERLIERLEQAGLIVGLKFIPLRIEPMTGKGANGWYCGFCLNDLGEAITAERFIPEFSRDNWHGEPFSTSLNYGEGAFIFVSQAVRQFFSQLSQKQIGQISFEPVMLVD